MPQAYPLPGITNDWLIRLAAPRRPGPRVAARLTGGRIWCLPRSWTCPRPGRSCVP